jgi:signal transduction histidine kinase
LLVVKGEKREIVGQEKPYKRGTIQRCYSIKTNNRRIKMLGAIGERTHYLAEQRCEAAILKERARMARDLHNTLAQGFTGVIMQMEAAEEALLEANSKQPD